MLTPPDALDLPPLVVFNGTIAVIARLLRVMEPCMEPGWNSDMSLTVTGFDGVQVYGYTEASGDGFLHVEGPEGMLALLDEGWPPALPCREQCIGRRVYQLWGRRSKGALRPGDPALRVILHRLALAA